MGWIFLLLTILSEVSGTTMMKLSLGFSKPVPSVLAIACYLGTLFFMTMTLKYLPISVTYAIWSGVGILLITVIGLVLFGESITAAKIFFISLILAGTIGLKLMVKS